MEPKQKKQYWAKAENTCGGKCRKYYWATWCGAAFGRHHVVIHDVAR